MSYQFVVFNRQCKWKLSKNGEAKHRALFITSDGRILVSYIVYHIEFCVVCHVLLKSDFLCIPSGKQCLLKGLGFIGTGSKVSVMSGHSKDTFKVQCLV